MAEERGDLDGAIDVYIRNFDAGGKQDPALAKQIGLLGLRRGRLPLAIGYLTMSNAIKPGDAEVLGGLARASFSTGDYSGAEAWYTELLTLHPDDPNVHMALARVAFAVMRYRQAETYATKALDGLAKATAADWILLGRSRQQLGKVEGAETALKEAIKLEPEDPTGYFYLGRLYDLLRMPKRAVRALSKAIELSPLFVEALSELGTAYLHDGAFDSAVATLSRARSISPDDPAVLNNLGIALRLADKPAKARAIFEEALALTGNSRVLFVNLADTHVKLGDFAKAQEVIADLVERGLARDEDRFELEKIVVLRSYNDVVCQKGGRFDEPSFAARLKELRSETGLETNPLRGNILPSILNDIELKVILDKANQRCQQTPTEPSP